MKYFCESGELRGFGDQLLKRLNCPLQKRWDQLQILDTVDPETGDLLDLKRHCASCQKDVININDFDESQVVALLRVDPAACVYATSASDHIEFVGKHDPGAFPCQDDSIDTPTIMTARTVAAMNHAARNGFWPLIREVKPSQNIKEKVIVFQDNDGTVEIAGDFRGGLSDRIFWFNPYRSPLPFAAYLIPRDLDPGSHVFVVDLIEDVVGETWNQGDSYRRQSAHAVWNGEDLVIEPVNPIEMVG